MLKAVVFSLGWIISAIIFFAAYMSLDHHWITDGLLWRFEYWESNPTIGQRIFETRSHQQNLWDDKLVPNGSVLIFGDSHMRYLPKSKEANVYNFAVSGQTIERMIPRLKQFKSALSASLIIINGGENDLSEEQSITRVRKSWVDALAALPSKREVLCVGLPETAGERVHRDKVAPLNELIRKSCTDAGAKFLEVRMDSDSFVEKDLSPDRMHLKAPAMEKLSEILDRYAKAKIK